ncbi:hypothetical protein GCM10009716_35880 [Streptomyces sodiiphilus]|uniref:Type I-E CRISPR-associated protein Cse2/CasB n=1 Tax=Streptomyces sodiiphilus TaxID=226217 RepID=A0ABP5AWR5_9ACTN
MTQTRNANQPRNAGYSRPLGITGTVVHELITPIQRGYLAVPDRPEAVAALARLRRGAGRPIEAVPDLWGLTGDPRLYPGGALLDEDAEHGELAAHIALTLYAVHQQSHRNDRMHVRDRPGTDLGGAVRRLMPGDEIDEALRRRFVQAGTAPDITTLSQRLRELVTLLRRDAVPLDYARLADQLHRAQQPGGLAEVRRAWGRGFHAYRPPAKKKDGQGDGDAPDPGTATGSPL